LHTLFRDSQLSHDRLRELAQEARQSSEDAYLVAESILMTWCAREPGRNIPAVAFLDRRHRRTLVEELIPEGVTRHTPESWHRASPCEQMSSVAPGKLVIPFEKTLLAACARCSEKHVALDWAGPFGAQWERKTLVICDARNAFRVVSAGAPPREFDTYEKLAADLDRRM
jgi:hypothetical protein